MQPAPGTSEDEAYAEGSTKDRPVKFIYDENDSFYFAPAMCKLLHYRTAAILCGLIEVAILALTVLVFFSKSFASNSCHFLTSLIIFY